MFPARPKRPILALFLVGLGFANASGCENIDYRPADDDAGGVGGNSQLAGAPSSSGSGGDMGSQTGGQGAGGADVGGAGPGPGGGSGGDTGPPPSGCLQGGIPFELETEEPGTFCTPPCGEPWLRLTQGSQAFDIEPECLPACESCTAEPCRPTACDGPSRVETTLSKLVTGEYFTPGNCGDEVSCEAIDCLFSGSYRAQFCLAVPAAGDAGDCQELSARQCVTVDFDWPRNTPVRAVLGRAETP